MKKLKQKTIPTSDDIANFLLLEPMIQSLVTEMRELSKKKPDGPLNKFKVEMINKRLKPMKELINFLPIAQFLDALDEESLPSNSDVVLILGQYEGALEAYREAFRGRDSIGYHGWKTSNGFIRDQDI